MGIAVVPGTIPWRRARLGQKRSRQPHLVESV
jgi:hypothetical protein